MFLKNFRCGFLLSLALSIPCFLLPISGDVLANDSRDNTLDWVIKRESGDYFNEGQNHNDAEYVRDYEESTSVNEEKNSVALKNTDSTKTDSRFSGTVSSEDVFNKWGDSPVVETTPVDYSMKNDKPVGLKKFSNRLRNHARRVTVRDMPIDNSKSFEYKLYPAKIFSNRNAKTELSELVTTKVNFKEYEERNFASFRVIDKISGRVSTKLYQIGVDYSIFNGANALVERCLVNPRNPAENYAFVRYVNYANFEDGKHIDGANEKRGSVLTGDFFGLSNSGASSGNFSGWLLSDNISVSTLEDRRVDLVLLNCAQK